jgi:hypothetical protein
LLIIIVESLSNHCRVSLSKTLSFSNGMQHTPHRGRLDTWVMVRRNAPHGDFKCQLHTLSHTHTPLTQLSNTSLSSESLERRLGQYIYVYGVRLSSADQCQNIHRVSFLQIAVFFVLINLIVHRNGSATVGAETTECSRANPTLGPLQYDGPGDQTNDFITEAAECRCVNVSFHVEQ